MRELKANLVRGPLPTNSVLVSETTSGNRHPETTPELSILSGG